MLDPAASASATTLQTLQAKPRAVFKMITSDRMAGSVPAWIPADSAKNQTLAASSNTNSDQNFAGDLSHATAYGPQQTGQNTAPPDDEPFGFGDLVDIVNPLQHIPLVSNLYRSITGDHIRPSAEIIGGAIYGGVAGAASGLANVIIKKETGETMMEHAVALVEGGSSTSTASATANADKPLERLAQAQTDIQTGTTAALPGAALSFVDLRHQDSNRPVKPIPEQPSRLAGLYKFNE